MLRTHSLIPGGAQETLYIEPEMELGLIACKTGIFFGWGGAYP